jgi:hypothetical protein
LKQTICRKISTIYNYKQNTIQISHNFCNLIIFLILLLKSSVSALVVLILLLKSSVSALAEKGACITIYFKVIVITIISVLVKKFVYSYNPQITKARIIFFNLYKSNTTLSIGLSMLVGISEAIRLLVFNFIFLHLNLNLIDLYLLKLIIDIKILNLNYSRKNIKFSSNNNNIFKLNRYYSTYTPKQSYSNTANTD